jgi:hypothetical protein
MTQTRGIVDLALTECGEPARLLGGLRGLPSALTVAAILLAVPAGVPRADDQKIGSAISANGKVQVDVLSLKRTDGDTVTLRWQVVNNGEQAFSMTVDNSRLVDLVGRREYSPGVSSPSCRAEAHQRTMCWATFAAPAAGTKKMSVRFYEQFDLISGVEITE